MTKCELRKLRNNLSQRVLAERLGVAKNTVSRWECGTRQISRLTSIAIRAALQL